MQMRKDFEWVWEKSDLQETVDNLPVASRHKLVVEGVEGDAKIDTSGFHGISLRGKLVGVVSPRYALVQHREAFGPVVKGLDELGIQYEWGIREHKGKTSLDVITEDIIDTVHVGFRVINSVDGTSAIRYDFNLKKGGILKLVGYREVCKNGMVIEVPLNNAEFVKPEIRGEVETLLQEHINIRHIGSVEKQLEAIKYTVKVITLLKQPIADMIQRAMDKKLSRSEVRLLIKEYIGKRMAEPILREYILTGDKTLWGLYNAATYTASHADIKQITANGLLLKSAKLLREGV